MSNQYEEIVNNSKDWEEQIPLLERIRDITSDEIKNIKKELKKIEQEEYIINQEYNEINNKKSIIIQEENRLKNKKEKLNNKLYNITILLLSLIAAVSFFLILGLTPHVCTIMYKFLNIFSISKKLLTTLLTLGVILFDICVITAEYKFILPKIFDKILDKIPNYTNNLKKFSKLKTLEREKEEIEVKETEKQKSLEDIQKKHQEYIKLLEFKEEYLKFIKNDIKTKILANSYYENEQSIDRSEESKVAKKLSLQK